MGTGKRGRLRAPIFACILGVAAIILVDCQNPFVTSNGGQNLAQNQGLVSFATPGPLASPLFSPSAGSYSADQTVSISCGTLGASLYYTTDGTTPTRSSTLYSGPIPVTGNGASKTIQVLAVKSGFQNASSSATFLINYSQVSTPQFSPPSGSYTSDQSISLSCATQGASLYYTIDGSAPTLSSTLYSGPIPIAVAGNGTSKTIRVLGIKTGLTDAVASASYTISYPQAAEPQFSPPAGSYSGDQNIALSTATPGASLYYTTDGSIPTSSSALYSGPIPVTGDGTTKTIKALVVVAGFTDAGGSADYKINYSQVSSPLFSPPAGNYSSDQTVSLSCVTPGASLYYTTDGTAPTLSSTLYVLPILVAGNGTSKTIRVLAVKAGFGDGGASAGYTISYPQVASPSFSPPAGTYGADITVALNCSTPGAMLYYEIGSTMATTATPTTASSPYLGLIPVSGNPSTLAIKVLAVKAGMLDGSATASYAISYPTLYIDRTGNGNTFPTAFMTTPHQAGIPVPITATPVAGSHFVNWTVTGGATVDSPNSSSANATLSNNGTVTANFALDQYTLNPGVSGGGSMTPSVAGPVSYGVATPIIATANPGWHFVNWAYSGASVASIFSSSTTVTLWGPSAGSVTANFAANPSRVTAVAYGGQIWSTPDSGATWSAGNSTTNNWTSITGSGDGTRLFASYGAYSVSSPIYSSLDGGATWNATSALPLAYGGLASSDDGSIIGASVYNTSQLFYYSKDTGSTWGNTIAGYQWWSAPVVSSNGLRWVMENGGDATPNVRIHTGSFDGGSGWTWTATSWDAGPFGYPMGYSVSKNGQKIFFAYASQLHVSNDFGASWNTVNFGSLHQVTASAMSGDGNTYAVIDLDGGGNSQLYTSMDGGATWILRITGLPAQATPNRYNAPSISYDGSKIAIYSQISPSTSQGQVFLSTDGGASFTVQTLPGVGGRAYWYALYQSQ